MFYLVLSLFLSIVFSDSGFLTVQVEPRTEECYFIRGSPGESLRLSFLVTRGGQLDIKARVESPSGYVLHEDMHFFKEGASLATAAVKVFSVTEVGTFKACFDNQMSRWTAKVVQFSFDTLSSAEAAAEAGGATRLGGPRHNFPGSFGNRRLSTPPPAPAADEDRLAKVHEVGDTERAMRRAVSTLSVLDDKFREYRMRTERHLGVQAGNVSTIWWMSTLESLILIAVAVGQVYFMRSWFSRRATARI